MAVGWRLPLTPFVSGAGTAVTAAALTSGLATQPFPQIPPNLWVQGTRLILECHGEVTSTSATPTVILGFYVTSSGGGLGQAIGSKLALGVTAALAISSSASAWPFDMRLVGTLRTVGPTNTAVVHVHGRCNSWFNVGLSGDGTVNPLPITQALRTVSTVNVSQVNEVDVGITLSSTTGTPSVTITDFWGELSG